VSRSTAVRVRRSSGVLTGVPIAHRRR
jgi:hypothetical protein